MVSLLKCVASPFLADRLPFAGVVSFNHPFSERSLRFHQTVPVSNLGLKDIARGGEAVGRPVKGTSCDTRWHPTSVIGNNFGLLSSAEMACGTSLCYHDVSLRLSLGPFPQGKECLHGV